MHGCYILAQFLSSQANRREDRYGGSPENRARLVTDIIRGVRERCRPDFQVGLRLAPGRYGPPTGEMLAFCERLMTSGMLDWLNLHLTDLDVRPAEEEYQGKRVIDWFAGVRRGRAKLGAAGGITSGQDARWLLAQGFDFPVIGRAAVLHHDLPRKIAADREFRAIAIPVTRAYLAAEGIGDAFIERMRKYDFVAD